MFLKACSNMGTDPLRSHCRFLVVSLAGEQSIDVIPILICFSY